MSLGKVLVTGGAGFVGSHLVERLIALNVEVVVLDNLSISNKLTFRGADKVHFINGDIRDRQTVNDACKGCKYIVHLAAIVGVEEVIERAFEMVETETIGTYNVVHAAINNKVRKVLYASSSAVYHKIHSNFSKENDPLGLINTYAVAKRLNEKYLEALTEDHGISTNSMRFFNVYGGRQDARMVIPRFFNQAMTNSPILIFGNGKQTRDFTYIEDVVDGMLALMGKKELSGIFNISRGVETRIEDLAKQIVSTTKSKSIIQCIPFPPSRETFRVDRRIGSAEKLARYTGFQPSTCLDAGLEKYFKNLLIVQQTAGQA